ncbi:pantetheine-phosphate adenylyltransferase [Sandaracinomonas limnophila]|uniref:Phosphopantetheine adenylyltransferase n=1 Tax=Sandaracinomonas limnophila TaxID=1862386 RepID=A0A437PX90_9BACT|nr:pantetheine-phosphate adenylyltransferase [Sandaracinomonas limnophila]RVU26859.1 pantetheine-phosphate adenylyltransferase [Sandaracinomonas limnophila]
MKSPKIAFFPGSFDPFTKGHEDIVLRAIGLFDEIVIGIGHNSNKNRYFKLEEMQAYIEETFKGKPVKIISYQGLTASVAKQVGAKYILRGLRNTTDFEYENSISQVNRHINEDLETIFLITSPHLAPISSTIIRDLHKYGSPIDEYLPYKLKS